MALTHASQNLPLEGSGELAFQWPPTRSVDHCPVTLLPEAQQQTAHLTVSFLDPWRRCNLRQILLLYFVQDAQ
jgi:hypothetical protein